MIGHLRWVLLLVCVGYALWPLLSARSDGAGKDQK